MAKDLKHQEFQIRVDLNTLLFDTKMDAVDRKLAIRDKKKELLENKEEQRLEKAREKDAAAVKAAEKEKTDAVDREEKKQTKIREREDNKRAADDRRNLNAEERRRKAHYQKLIAQYKRFNQKMGRMSGAAFGAMRTAGIGGALIGGAAVANMLKVGISFRKEMSDIAAVTNASDEEMAGMTKRARDLGKTTAFTATEAAQGMQELARAGLRAEEIVEAIEPALKLAGATNYGLASSTRVVVAAMKQFTLGAEDAEKIANVFAEATRQSLLDMPSLAEAMKYAGTIGAGFGMSLEATTAAVAAFRNMGLEGSLAGTNFRMAMASAAKQTKKKGDVLRQLGLTYKDINPEQKSFYEILLKVGEANASVTQGQIIFGQRAGANVITLSRNAKKLKEFKEGLEAVNEQGAPVFTEQEKIDKLNEFTEGMTDLVEIQRLLEESSEGLGTANKMYTKSLDNVWGQAKMVAGAYEEINHVMFQLIRVPLKKFLKGLAIELRGMSVMLDDVGAGISTLVKGGFEDLLEIIKHNSESIVEGLVGGLEALIELFNTLVRLTAENASGFKEMADLAIALATALAELVEFLNEMDFTVAHLVETMALVWGATKISAFATAVYTVAIPALTSLTGAAALAAKAASTLRTNLVLAAGVAITMAINRAADNLEEQAKHLERLGTDIEYRAKFKRTEFETARRDLIEAWGTVEGRAATETGVSAAALNMSGMAPGGELAAFGKFLSREGIQGISAAGTMEDLFRKGGIWNEEFVGDFQGVFDQVLTDLLTEATSGKTKFEKLGGQAGLQKTFEHRLALALQRELKKGNVGVGLRTGTLGEEQKRLMTSSVAMAEEVSKAFGVQINRVLREPLQQIERINRIGLDAAQSEWRAGEEQRALEEEAEDQQRTLDENTQAAEDQAAAAQARADALKAQEDALSEQERLLKQMTALWERANKLQERRLAKEKVEELKEEIAALKESLEDLVLGTEEYSKVIAEIKEKTKEVELQAALGEEKIEGFQRKSDAIIKAISGNKPWGDAAAEIFKQLEERAEEDRPDTTEGRQKLAQEMAEEAGFGGDERLQEVIRMFLELMAEYPQILSAIEAGAEAKSEKVVTALVEKESDALDKAHQAARDEAEEYMMSEVEKLKKDYAAYLEGKVYQTMDPELQALMRRYWEAKIAAAEKGEDGEDIEIDPLTGKPKEKEDKEKEKENVAMFNMFEQAKKSLKVIFVDWFKEKVQKLWEKLPKELQEKLNLVFKKLGTAVAIIRTAVVDIPAKAMSMMGIEGGWRGLINQSMEGGGPQMVLDASNALIEGLNRLAMDFQGIINTMMQKLPEIVGTLLTNLPTILKTTMDSGFKFIEFLLEMLPGLIDGIAAFIPEAVQFIPKLVSMVFAMLPDILTSLLDGIVVAIEELVRAIPSLVEGILVALPDIISALIRAIPEIVGALVEIIPQLIAAIIRAIPEIIRLVITMIPEIIFMLIRLVPEIIIALIRGIPDMVLAFKEAIADKLFNKEWWKSIGKEFKLMWEEFVQGLKDALNPTKNRTEGYQSGTPFVPRTGLAYLHKGEAIIPAESNPWNSASPKSAVSGSGAGGGQTNISLAVNADGQLLDSILVKAGRKGRAPELFRAMRKTSGVALGFDRGNFAPKSR